MSAADLCFQSKGKDSRSPHTLDIIGGLAGTRETYPIKRKLLDSSALLRGKTTDESEKEGILSDKENGGRQISCVVDDGVKANVAIRSEACSRHSPKPSPHMDLDDQTPSAVGTKVPNPTLGHSTPSGGVPAKSSGLSLFGFEQLESPLLLSPVTCSPKTDCLAADKVEVEEAVQTPSVRQHRWIYDIPLRRSTPRRAPNRKKAQQVCN